MMAERFARCTCGSRPAGAFVIRFPNRGRIYNCSSRTAGGLLSLARARESNQREHAPGPRKHFLVTLLRPLRSLDGTFSLPLSLRRSKAQGETSYVSPVRRHECTLSAFMHTPAHPCTGGRPRHSMARPFRFANARCAPARNAPDGMEVRPR